jgi:hypothetical protein
MKTTLPEIFAGAAPGKDEIAGQCLQIIKSIKEDGTINPLRIATSMKALETAIKLIRDGIEDAIIEEAEKYEKTFDIDGHKITLKETGVRYDYSVCKDPEWEELTSTLSNTKEAIKKRETFLKSVSEPFTLLDERTGEVVRIELPNKTSKTNISITLK